jgi:ubiquinone/menaquinone biosynthesis C-methylase UbiE
VALLGGNRARGALIAQAQLEAGERVLEIGSGTGTLLVMVKRLHPDARVTGLDPDPKALDRARRKATAASLPIQLDQGFADALPYANGSFDCVLSCFMFHHLRGVDEKRRSLRELRRVLRCGGRLVLLDFAPPDAGHDGGVKWLLHSSRLLEDNTESRLLSLIGSAGFIDGRAVHRSKLGGLFRTVYYRAAVPEEGSRA